MSWNGFERKSVNRDVRKVQNRFKTFVVTTIASVVAIGFVIGFNQNRAISHDTSPLILKEIQELGELRTVSHRVARVYEYETHRDAQGWTAAIPFANEIVAATTSNKVLLSAEADVQAGVDLSKARVVKSRMGTTIFLPEPQIYEPVVSFTVHNEKKGMLWKDINITGKAQREFSQVVKSSSRDSGILETAKSRTETLVSELAGKLGSQDISIVFQS